MSGPDATTNAQSVTAALRDHASGLRSFVRARVPAAEVEDLLQSVALRAVERASTLEDPGKALPWLYRLHRNAIVDAGRRRDTRRRVLDDFAAVEQSQAAQGQERDGRCQCSLVQAQRLSPPHARILALVDVQGESLTDAAETLGITVNNATVRLHRARKALRHRMQRHCGVTRADECGDCRCTYEGCCAA